MLNAHGDGIVDMITDAVDDGIETQKDLYRVVELSARAVALMHGDITTLAHEVYGNGTPGGLKLAVNTMDKRLCEINKKLESLVAESGAGNTTFDKMLAWLTDKILPALITSMIMSFLALIAFMAFVFYAWQSGLMDVVIFGAK